MEQAFLDFAKQYGLPFALVVFALVTGAMGRWYFGSVVKKLEDGANVRFAESTRQYEARLTDKDKQITQWQEAAKLDAVTSQESLRLMQGVNETLVRIEKRLESESRRRV